MKAPQKTNICSNCGASDGLHHYSTNQCPKNGIEEYREGEKQEWEETTFQEKTSQQLKEAAPELAKALERCISSFETSKTGGFNGHGKEPEAGSSYVIARNALLMAGYTEN